MIRLGYPFAGILYKLGVLIGIVLIGLTVYWVSLELDEFEVRAGVVYEMAIMTSLELDSLNKEMLALEAAIEGTTPAGEEQAIDYSKEEIARLMLDLNNIRAQLEESTARLVSVTETKRALFRALAITFGGALASLLLGVLLLILGLIGWRFRIKIFEDRRRAPRAEGD